MLIKRVRADKTAVKGAGTEKICLYLVRQKDNYIPPFLINLMDNNMFEEALFPGGKLPAYPKFESGIRRAPDRGCRLTKHQKEVALRKIGRASCRERV